MIVYLDGERIEPDRDTLRGAFESAIKQADASGRIVVEIHADGEPIPDEFIADPPESASGFTELRFVSAEPRSMVRTLLLDAADALDTVKSDQQSAAEAIQGGRLDDARKTLERAVGVWSAVITGVHQGSSMVGLDLESVSAGNPPMPYAQHVEQLENELRAVVRMISDEDWSSLSDSLEDELTELTERWRELLHALADRVPPASASDGPGT